MLTLYSPKIQSLPYVHDTHHVSLEAGRQAGPRGARLHHGLQGAGPGRHQEPEGQAASDREDDGPPLPLLRARPRGRGARAAAGAVPDSSAGAARSTRSAARRWARTAFRARYGINNRTADGSGAGLEAHRDGDEPLQEAEELLRPHAGLLHDREAQVGSAARDRRSAANSPTACPTTFPGGGKKGSNFVDKSDWAAPYNGRMLMAPSHQHGGGQVPDALEPHLQAAAVQVARLPRTREARLQHDPADPARARPDRQRRLRQLRRASRSTRARCCGGWRCTTTTTCTSPRWASGSLWFVQDDSVKQLRQACRTTSSRSTGPGASTERRTTSSRCRSSPSRRARSSAFNGGRAHGGRRLLPARQDHREGRPAGHLALLGRRSRTP